MPRKRGVPKMTPGAAEGEWYVTAANKACAQRVRNFAFAKFLTTASGAAA
jgi:hypothetical protein